MRIIFLGAPGAGKGTQAEIVSANLGIPTISTGVIIREAIKNGTEQGTAAKVYTERGDLVPDEVVIGIIKERLAKEDCKKGFILDGFPRTLPQANALRQMGVDIDKVINFDVSDEAVIRRMSGRRVCDSCPATFHVTNNPSGKGEICDRCGGKLITRKDDTPEVVKSRLAVYHEQTEPLIGFYSDMNILTTVNGEQRLDGMTADTLAAINVKIS